MGKIITTVSIAELEFLRPLIYWYQSGSAENLPVRVQNALDSLEMFLGDK